MAQLHLLFINNDTIVELDTLVDASDGTFVNDATVTADVDTLEGDSIASGISMAYVASSDGKYQGTIQDTLSLVVNQFYLITVTAIKAGTKGTWELKAQCVPREE